MAEKKKEEKEKKPKQHNTGVIPFGLEVVLFILAIFIIWVLTGGIKSAPEEKPFITPLSDPINPGMKYGPEDIRREYNPNYQQQSNTQYKTIDIR